MIRPRMRSRDCMRPRGIAAAAGAGPVVEAAGLGDIAVGAMLKYREKNLAKSFLLAIFVPQ